MPITLIKTLGELKRFRSIRWSHQATFQVQKKSIRRFVEIVVLNLGNQCISRITFDEVIFEPKKLDSLFAQNGIPINLMKTTKYLNDWTAEACGASDINALLEAALSEAIDFVFQTTPSNFSLYADHDEYVTLFSKSSSGLKSIEQSLVGAKYDPVHGYHRTL